jgi:hypothetical protein
MGWLTFGDTIKNIWVENISRINGDPAQDSLQGLPVRTSAAAYGRDGLIFLTAKSISPRRGVLKQQGTLTVTPWRNRDLTIPIGFCSFSFAEKKTNQKKPPAPLGPAGCPVLLAAGGPCGTRWRSNSHRAFSAGCCDARLGTMGDKPPAVTGD